MFTSVKNNTKVAFCGTFHVARKKSTFVTEIFEAFAKRAFLQEHSVELRSGWKAEDSECIGIARILEAPKDFVRILAFIIRIYKQISEKGQERKYLQHIDDLLNCQWISRYNSKTLVLFLMRKLCFLASNCYTSFLCVIRYSSTITSSRDRMSSNVC